MTNDAGEGACCLMWRRPDLGRIVRVRGRSGERVAAMVGNSVDGLYFDLRIDFPGRQIAVLGEFDVATARCLTTAVSKFARSAISELTIDLANVTHIDAAGVGALTRARSAMSGRVAFNGGSAALQRLLAQADLVAA
ncbi:MAG TPA: STAS domain-containing protein [Jatrophihabitans sp.]|uniref:STAS domain-containing protein n=1 Tax=Jatrophihabitans sp. TaxID=1932789 RepID=UPI002DFE6492|nr:STAS domain-containing protein [Jatrophihabitans sp.]